MKKLTLALLACLTVAASAQSRHYATGDAVVTVLPGGATVETRMVEVVPMEVLRVSETPVLYTLPAATRVEVRHYDTADTLDEVRFPRETMYDVLYETRTTTTTIEEE
jgi:hypothetical protein